MTERIVWQVRIDPRLVARVREAAYQERSTIADLVARSLTATVERLEAKRTTAPKRKART